MHSTKIQDRHLERDAIVYVRQSTVRQILENTESTRLQYALVERAVILGWARDRVTVIDEDQGKSAASAESRTGFRRIVSEVTLGHVGLILGVEMSRLARSCADWHQLLEACGLFGTLIADLDGVYDPSEYNDRLLLGLKGTMSEAELHVIKQRMQQGRLQKAKRGELALTLPIGYTRSADGKTILDPDAEVQASVRMLFRTFEERRTLHATLRHLVAQGVRMGVRSGGRLEWRRPCRPTLANLLHNPAHAGAYAYGRRQTDPRCKKGGRPSTGRVTKSSDQWHVLIKDHHPAYITWEQYEQNVETLAANAAKMQPGPVRSGSALLSGLVVCVRCGRRIQTRYAKSGQPQYVCQRILGDYGVAGQDCGSVPSAVLDKHVSRHLLNALAPAGLEVSLAAQRDIRRERQAQRQLRVQRIERARFEVERAHRQYALVEPENRLVARQLETSWEERLQKLGEMERSLERFDVEHAHDLTELERQAIVRLSEDLPALWTSQRTTVMDRKEIIREAIEKVSVHVRGRSELVDVTIHWKGGSETGSTCVRPVATYEQLSYYNQLLSRMDKMRAAGLCLHDVMEAINREGFRPPKRATRFTKYMLFTLLRREGRLLPTGRRRRAVACAREHEWTLQSLSRRLGITTSRLYGWLQRQWLDARLVRDEVDRKRWLIWADEREIHRLRSLATQMRTTRRRVRDCES